MGKASTNAGIHPYLKPDFVSSIVERDQKGIPFSTKPIKFKSSINTEYKDSNNNYLHSTDSVTLDGAVYKVDYDGKQFRWIIVGNNKIHSLSEVHKRLKITKKTV